MCIHSQHPCVILAGCLQDPHLAHEKIKDQHAKKRDCNLGFVELFGLSPLTCICFIDHLQWRSQGGGAGGRPPPLAETLPPLLPPK